MKIKRLLLLLLLVPMVFFGQIRISETIKMSSIASDENNALYFVDFWATWCGPCIAAEKQLASLQRQYPKNFYVMSLSQESPEVVRRYMKKHDLQLGVAIDYNGETFSNYNIASLPYGILLNAKGEKLWEGHPADFKTYHLDGYLNTNTKQLSVEKMFKLQSYKPLAVTKDITLNGDYDIKEIDETIERLQVVKKPNFLELSGSLKDIMAYANNVYTNQINITSKLNKTYRMRFKNNTSVLYKIDEIVLRHLKLKQQDTLANGEVLFFNLSGAHFWDVNQIDWGNDTPNFLIGDADIKADNVSLNQVSFQLANLLELPVIASDNSMANELHDWEIHYKYFDLMSSSLKDTYGIKIEKKISEYPKYMITKKAP